MKNVVSLRLAQNTPLRIVVTAFQHCFAKARLALFLWVKSINEPDRKKKIEALESIKSAFGTKDDEYGATLFVSHHLEELDADYWVKQLGTSIPQPMKILKLLQFKSNWDAGLVF